MHSPIITVIVPTCNRVDLLSLCLKRLDPAFQTLASTDYVVLVSEDGDPSASKLLVETQYPWAKWTKGPSRGPAGNRNHAISLATSIWVVFIDDDCLPVADLLSVYASSARMINSSSSVILMGATIRAEEPRSLMFEAPHNPTASVGITANFAIPKALFISSGQIDERFRYSLEDVEFFARLGAMGCQFVSLSAAIVYHPVRRRPSPKTLARRWESLAINGFDHGASPLTVAWRLPWHAGRVIQSRFREAEFSIENATAAIVFFQEWLWVLFFTPIWIIKWNREPRNPFWKCEEARRGRKPRFGF